MHHYYNSAQRREIDRILRENDRQTRRAGYLASVGMVVTVAFLLALVALFLA